MFAYTSSLAGCVLNVFPSDAFLKGSRPELNSESISSSYMSGLHSRDLSPPAADLEPLDEFPAEENIHTDRANGPDLRGTSGQPLPFEASTSETLTAAIEILKTLSRGDFNSGLRNPTDRPTQH